MNWTASKLSRNCAHHHVLSELHPRPTRDAAAAKGTTFHAALAEWQKTGVVPTMADADIAGWLQTMVDHGWAWPDRCELEVAWGLDTWGMFTPVEETSPHVYRSIAGEDLLTAGRADCCWVTDGLLVVVDWKTGRTMAPPAATNLQVNAAGIALAAKWRCNRWQPAIYYARSGVWDMGPEVERSSPEHMAMIEDIETAAALDEKPHKGPHCDDGPCWEKKHCGAWK